MATVSFATSAERSGHSSQRGYESPSPGIARRLPAAFIVNLQCQHLIKLSDSVIQFYVDLDEASTRDPGIVALPSNVYEAQRLWQKFGDYKSGQLLSRLRHDSHFIDAGEVGEFLTREHNLTVLPAIFNHAIMMANSATLLHYLWSLPEDPQSVSRQGQADSLFCPYRSLAEIENCRHAFLVHIIPLDVKLTRAILDLQLDLCVQTFIARLRALTRSIRDGKVSVDDAEAEAEADLSELVGNDAIEPLLVARPLTGSSIVRIRAQWTSLATPIRQQLRGIDYDEEGCRRIFPTEAVARRITELIFQLRSYTEAVAKSLRSNPSFVGTIGSERLQFRTAPQEERSVENSSKASRSRSQTYPSLQAQWLQKILSVNPYSDCVVASISVSRATSKLSDIFEQELETYSLSSAGFASQDRMSILRDMLGASSLSKASLVKDSRLIDQCSSRVVVPHGEFFDHSLSFAASPAMSTALHDIHQYQTSRRVLKRRPESLPSFVSINGSASVEGSLLNPSEVYFSSERSVSETSVDTYVREAVMEEIGFVEQAECSRRPPVLLRDRHTGALQARLVIRNGTIQRADSMPPHSLPFVPFSTESGHRLSRFDSQKALTRQDPFFDRHIAEFLVRSESPEAEEIQATRLTRYSGMSQGSPVSQYPAKPYIQGLEVHIEPPPLSPRTRHLVSQGYQKVEILPKLPTSGWSGPWRDLDKAEHDEIGEVVRAARTPINVGDDGEVDWDGVRDLLPSVSRDEPLFEGDTDPFIDAVRKKLTVEHWFKKERPGFENFPLPTHRHKSATEPVGTHQRSQARDEVLTRPTEANATVAAPAVFKSTSELDDDGVVFMDGDDDENCVPARKRTDAADGTAADGSREPIEVGPTLAPYGSTLSQRNKRLWTQDEMQCLLPSMSQLARNKMLKPRYQVWAEILSHHGIAGSEDDVLGARNNHDLKSKARAELVRMIEDGETLPYWRKLYFPDLLREQKGKLSRKKRRISGGKGAGVRRGRLGCREVKHTKGSG